MHQRIGISQAIVHRPQVLFLDEPTPGLDPMGVRQLRETVRRLNSDLGVTVFMNTHLLSEDALTAARTMGDQRAITSAMRNGTGCLSGG